jgi:hypothetical protein
MMARCALLLLATLLLVAGPEARSDSDPARTFLATAFSVSPADIARIDAGQVFSRTLDVSHPREVATLGIVRMGVTPEFYIERLKDIVTFKRDDAVLQIGAFLQAAAARGCCEAHARGGGRSSFEDVPPGNCDVKLSAGAIERFRADVTWRGADVQSQATQLMRRILVDYVDRYSKIGAPATMEYANTSASLNLGDEFASLMAADTRTWQYVPHLRRHLVAYPAADPDGASDFVYWSKERVNRRPVISVTHIAIVPEADTAGPEYAIASKQIYGMHYFDASLGITLLVRDRTSASPATYVVYLNRSRVDLFGGLFGGMARKVVSGKARTVVSEQLAQLNRTLAPQFAASRVATR